MTSDEEKREKLHRVCCDGCSIGDLEDEAGASPVIEEFHGDYDSKLPHECYETAIETGTSLEGSLGPDVGIDQSEEDCAELLSRKDTELLDDYVMDAPPRMEIDRALDFAEGYMRLIQATQRKRDYVLSLLEAELVTRVPQPPKIRSSVRDMPDKDSTPEELARNKKERSIFKLTKSNLTDAARAIEESLYTPESVTIFKDEIIQLMSDYCEDYKNNYISKN